MSACITKEEYVIWVKGSLNRWLGARLSESGDTAPPYRGWVKEFQAQCEVCTRNGDVDEATQNALITANHQHDRYVSWVQQALSQGQQAASVEGDGVMTPKTIDAIKNFQSANGLDSNGWVGAKTETVLRKKSKKKPPTAPPKIMPLIFHPKWGARTARELALFWSDQLVLEPLTEPLAGLNPLLSLSHRVYLRKFLTALWQIDSDNEYVPGNRVADLVVAGRDNSALGGIDPDKIPHEFHTKYKRDALADLIRETGRIMNVENWSYANGYEKFKQMAFKLYKSVYDSLANICYEVSTSDRTNFAVHFMGDWLYEKQKEGSNSVLRVFPEQLHVRRR